MAKTKFVGTVEKTKYCKEISKKFHGKNPGIVSCTWREREREGERESFIRNCP